jgi:hypothetical protein
MSICIPRAQGVPGLSTAPNWFDNTSGAPPLRPIVDDPRWTGAYNRGFGDGTAMEAQFRALYMDPDWRGKKSLFLSWQVLYDGALNDGMDRLYLGFSNGGAAAADSLVLKIVAYNSSSADISAGGPGSIEAFTMDPATGNGTPVVPPPAWLGDTRVWLTTSSKRWSIHMYVPYDPAAMGLFSNAGINLPDPFQMFYQIYVLTPTRAQGGVVQGGFVAHTWPLAALPVVTMGGDVYPHPSSTWESFHLSTGPGDPLCPSAGGVSIIPQNIGNMVDGGAPNIVVEFSPTSPQPVNTLFANVDNQTGATIPVTGITARFRIADWGSVIMDPLAPWSSIRGGDAVTNAVSIPTGLFPIGPGNPPPLSFDWTLNATEMAPYMSGKPSDQCLLVELQGAGITFWSDSARRNLLVQSASEVVKTAQISVEGLAPIPGGGPVRDVYVAVETVNMPPVRIPDPRAGQGAAPGSFVVWDEKKLGMLRRSEINPEVLAALARKGVGAALAIQPDLFDTLVEMAPVYRVHVYHDTGGRLTVNGASYPVLGPQTSFGMLLDHAGELTGWEHGLEFGPGVLRQEIAPGFYRIHVPENGKVHAKVRVRAVEPGETPGETPGPVVVPKKWPWWIWLLLFLAIVLLVLLLT